jgi:hypothetical protein
MLDLDYIHDYAKELLDNKLTESLAEELGVGEVSDAQFKSALRKIVKGNIPDWVWEEFGNDFSSDWFTDEPDDENEFEEGREDAGDKLAGMLALVAEEKLGKLGAAKEMKYIKDADKVRQLVSGRLNAAADPSVIISITSEFEDEWKEDKDREPELLSEPDYAINLFGLRIDDTNDKWDIVDMVLGMLGYNTDELAMNITQAFDQWYSKNK